MGKAKGKQRLDKFYHLAKEQGYRSRAAFKLVQLDAKYGFLSSARGVLDLCAAPGGWMQVAVQKAPVGAFIVGVDLHPIRPIHGAHAFTADITTPKCRSQVRELMNKNGVSAFNVVLHDGSPDIGGAWASEATMQATLVVDALRLATQFLSPKGTFVTKVFRSQDYSAVIFCLKQLFEKVEVTKPVASRSTSAEIYVIGQRYKAPAKIDPRLLDVKFLFKGAVEQPKVVDVLKGSKQKRNREGYEDGNTTLRKVGKVSDFIWSETPLEFLGSVNVLSFEDPTSLSIRDHELTTEEIRSLCEDLYVLDKHSFKHLLRWRMHVRKALSSNQKVASKGVDAEDEKKGNEDECLLNEMEELTDALERKKKRSKKLLAKRRAKDKLRKATGMQIDATEDSYNDNSLFSLSSIKGRKGLQAIESTEINDEDADFIDSESGESDGDEHHDAFPDDMNSDEEQQRYDGQVEDILDEAYEQYVTRHGGSTKLRKRAKLALTTNADNLLEGGEGDDLVLADPDSDQDEDAKDFNPLVVPFDEEKLTKEKVMEKWFSQDVFDDPEEKMELENSDSEDDREKKVPKVSKKKAEKITGPKDSSPTKAPSAQQEDFEIVPADPVKSSDDDSSSSDESEEEDDHTKAEILAVAKQMLRKRKREEILDDAYNRYMFDDRALAPKWFAEDEKRHGQPIKPVTREEIAAMKAQFREIDARPAKKVAQAKARKKRVAMKKLEKVRHKADAISDQTDISERSKDKMIDKLYKKAAPKKPQKEYVVAKKGIQVRAGKGKVLVDRRMKKDARSQGMGRSGKGGSKKGKKGEKGKGKGKGLRNKGSGKPTGRKVGRGGKRPRMHG